METVKTEPMAHIESVEDVYGPAIKPHTHMDERGVIHRCYHECKQVFTQAGFWIGVTVSFPLEHFIWTKVPGFMYISKLMGLSE